MLLLWGCPALTPRGGSKRVRSSWLSVLVPVSVLLVSISTLTAAERPPGFTRHIQPLLGKAGCSNRACHGSFQGQGGLRLSLFGSDPALDHANLTHPSRLVVAHPEQSLILQKPAQQVEHEGGQRFAPESWDYQLFHKWIAAGASYEPGAEPTVDRLEVTPARITLTNPEQKVVIQVVAHFADGTHEDVTRLTQFQPQDDRVALVSTQGEVRAGVAGDTAVIATYGPIVQAIPVLVPFPPTAEALPTLAQWRPLDRWIGGKLTELRIPSSPPASDSEFLRRVSLDITGTLPTLEEIRTFQSDTAADKRERKVNELLQRPAYTQWWTTILCDLTGLNAPLFLGNTDFGPLVGDLWHQWMQRQVRENRPYDRIVAGLLVASSRRAGESYRDYSLRMSSYVLPKDPVDFSSETEMPHFWFRENLKTPEEKALGVAYSFLGVRLECAQCHRHPFDRWSQQDFRQFAALFGRIQKGVSPGGQAEYDAIKGQFDAETLRTAVSRRQTYWKLAREGKPVPWPEVFVAPANAPLPKEAAELPRLGKLLGGATIDLAAVADPRQALMDWLRSPDNPYFAPAFVNRVWAHYFGRGLVHPPDDFNLANPATHPELLQDLSQRWIEAGFDLPWLHREITLSRTYQTSWRPLAGNRNDERNYSHAAIRRLPAEVAVDAIQQATAGSNELAAAKTPRRIAVQATADLRRTEYGLAVFGKPLRKVNCDCEREAEPSLLQAVFLRNDPDLTQWLDRPSGWLAEIANSTRSAESLVDEAYLRTVCRLPTAAERERCLDHLASSPTRREGLRDLLWSLLNTQEFITNH